jgi:hypothetical protein
VFRYRKSKAYDKNDGKKIHVLLSLLLYVLAGMASSSSLEIRVCASFLTINVPKTPENEETVIDSRFENLDSVGELLPRILDLARAERPWAAAFVGLLLARSSSLLMVVVIWFVAVTCSRRQPIL